MPHHTVGPIPPAAQNIKSVPGKMPYLHPEAAQCFAADAIYQEYLLMATTNEAHAVEMALKVEVTIHPPLC